MGFKVIHTGKESLDKDLADNSYKVNSFKNIENGNTFQLYNQILAKLPDFMIWKHNDEEFEHKFVEVKYRSKLDDITLTNKGFDYEILLDSNHDPLDLKKYFTNLDRVFSLLQDIKTKWIDLYVYLIVGKSENDKPNIYYGKVWKNDKGFKVQFLSIDSIDKSKYISKNWPNYKKIANYILSQQELFNLFNQPELMIRNSDQEIKDIVHSKLNI